MAAQLMFADDVVAVPHTYRQAASPRSWQAQDPHDLETAEKSLRLALFPLLLIRRTLPIFNALLN
jgi:hypothetical protein